MREIVSIAVG